MRCLMGRKLYIVFAFEFWGFLMRVPVCEVYHRERMLA